MLALARARASGRSVARLITFYDEDTGRLRFHGVPFAMLHVQADALGAELVAVGTAWEDMDARLREVLAAARADGCAEVVLGDIHLTDVRAWYEERVRAAGLEHVEPLWGEAPRAVLEAFVDGGGRAVVTGVDTGLLDERWLGRIVDQAFVRDIAAAGVDPCGERGEYHTFAFAGPPLPEALPWRASGIRRNGRFRELANISSG